MVRKALGDPRALRAHNSLVGRVGVRPRRRTACSSTARSGARASGTSRTRPRSSRGDPVVVEHVNGLTLTVRPAEEWEVAP